MVVTIKVALLANSWGIGRTYKGGPGVRGYALHKALSLVGVDSKVYYTGDEPYPYYVDEDCYRVTEFEKKIVSDGEETTLSDFDVYQSLNSSEVIQLCNDVGIEPIADSNIIPNSPPNHCLKYLSPSELSMRKQQILQEQWVVKNLKVSRWIYQSEFQLSEYQRLGMKDISICRHGHNGVDTDLFHPHEDQDNVIHWSGRDWWPKQPGLFAEIAKRLSSENFVAFSNDALNFTPNVKTYVGLLHYQLAEKLTGKLNICTSSTENEPLSILEGFASGLPVVAFGVSGIPELVEDGETGFLVEMEDLDGFVEKVEYLSEDENERLRMGKNARKMVEEKFSFKSMGETYKDIYEEVLS